MGGGGIGKNPVLLSASVQMAGLEPMSPVLQTLLTVGADANNPTQDWYHGVAEVEIFLVGWEIFCTYGTEHGKHEQGNAPSCILCSHLLSVK